MPKNDQKPSEDELMAIIMHTSRIVWQNELPRKHLEEWLSNFTGKVFSKDKERFLALWLLTHFTYYNQNEVTHLCKVVYYDLIHHILSNNSTSGTNPVDTVKEFFLRTNIIPAEQVSGSGGFISYFFRHINKLPMSMFNFSIDNVSGGVENVILIDDVSLTVGGTGQMYQFLDKTVPKYSNKKFLLLTLISSKDSIEELRSTFGVEVITAITLDARDKCFNNDSNAFSQFADMRTDCRQFAEFYGDTIRVGNVGPLGFENGEYAFGFFYNTPDNTLPIFWAQVNGWQPIVRRFHKNYGARNYLKDERFI
ncbi:MAG: hypothetical protein ACKVRN_11475 [Pyrinomonadaceae bacterium]